MISDYRYPGSGIMRAVHGASERASADKGVHHDYHT